MFDKEKRNQTVLKNRALVVGVLKNLNFTGCPDVEDLYHAGLEGLIIAADMYDESMGVKFCTYAYSVIRNYILREKQWMQETTYISYRLREHKSRILDAVSQYEMTHDGATPPISYLKEHFPKISEEDLMLVMSSSQAPVFLDAGVDNSYDTAELVPDTSSSVEDAVLEKVENETLREFVSNNLSSRERDILFRYYGIGGGEPETLEQLGQSFSVTKERVRQLRNAALLRLRNLLAAA